MTRKETHDRVLILLSNRTRTFGLTLSECAHYLGLPFSSVYSAATELYSVGRLYRDCVVVHNEYGPNEVKCIYYGKIEE